MNWSTLSGKDIIDRQLTPRLQNSPKLGVEFGFIGNVHCYVLSPEEIKSTVCKGHIKSVAMLEGNMRIKPKSLCEHAGDPAIFFGKVDPGDLATVLHGQAPGSATKTAADIQNLHRLIETKLPGELKRELTAAYVELINGGKVFYFELAHVSPGFIQCGQDDVSQTLTGIVGFYTLYSRVHADIPFCEKRQGAKAINRPGRKSSRPVMLNTHPLMIRGSSSW
jgi:hypothetical protein